MALFESEYSYYGKHALYCRFLKEKNVFTTFREIYLISTVVGFLNNYKVPVDRETQAQPASILPGEIVKQKTNLMFLYRVIMLLEDNSSFTIDDYKNRTFKDDVDDENPEKVKENMKIFDAYSRGGLEILYDKFKDCTTEDEFADVLYNYISEFAMDIGINNRDV